MNAKDASDPLAGLSRTQIFQLSRAEHAPIHRMRNNWSQSLDNAFKGLVKKGLFTCYQSPKGHWIFHRITPSGRALLPAIAEYFRADTEKQDVAMAEIQRADRISAAAPKLLAALERACVLLDRRGLHYKEGRAAIAKAKGE